MTKITIIKGDGIGPSIMDATTEILDALNCNFTYEYVLAGEEALEKTGCLLPETTIQSIKNNKIALKSPLNTPKGGGFKSINVQLRQLFDLYANYRPVKSYDGTKARYSNIDIITIRENTEGMYSGEGQIISDDGQVAESKSIVTKKGCERIIKYAFETALKYNRKKVTLCHKANILKTTSGLFLATGKEISKQYPTIEFNEMIIDNTFMQLIMRPEQFDVIVTTKLFGDILSDACAGLVGGLGMAAGANIGTDVAIFEAVHGTAPDIANQDKANPIALLLSSALMLEYLKMNDKANILRRAIQNAILDKTTCTGDLGGIGGTKSLTKSIIDYIKKEL